MMPWALEDPPSFLLLDIVHCRGPELTCSHGAFDYDAPSLVQVEMLGQLGAVLAWPGGVIAEIALDGSQSRVRRSGAGKLTANSIPGCSEEARQRNESIVRISPGAQGRSQVAGPGGAVSSFLSQPFVWSPDALCNVELRGARPRRDGAAAATSDEILAARDDTREAGVDI
eukprot:1476639-Pyramimonas_sp.AAC.1